MQLSTQFRLGDEFCAVSFEDEDEDAGGGTLSMVQVFQIASGDPNGVVTATAPAICYTTAGGLWTKTGVGNNNTGWVCMIAE